MTSVRSQKSSKGLRYVGKGNIVMAPGSADARTPPEDNQAEQQIQNNEMTEESLMPVGENTSVDNYQTTANPIDASYIQNSPFQQNQTAVAPPQVDDPRLMSFQNAQHLIQVQVGQNSENMTVKANQKEFLERLHFTTTLPLNDPDAANASNSGNRALLDTPQKTQVMKGTTQEVQTSFRPSIKDSAEFKKFGEDLMKLNYERAIVGTDTFINVEDFEPYSHNHDDEVEQRMLMNHQHNDIVGQVHPSTRRKPSLQSEDIAQQLPRSAVTSSRISANTKKDPSQLNPSVKSNSITPAVKQQILRQIYISVNTYGDKVKSAIPAEARSATQSNSPSRAENAKLNQRKSTLPVDQSRGTARRRDSGPSFENGTMTLKTRKQPQRSLSNNTNNYSSSPYAESRNNTVAQASETVATATKANNSLIIQPMLLGVRAVQKNQDMAGQQPQQSQQPQQPQQQVLGFTEFVFAGPSGRNGQQSNSRSSNKAAGVSKFQLQQQKRIQSNPTSSRRQETTTQQLQSNLAAAEMSKAAIDARRYQNMLQSKHAQAMLANSQDSGSDLTSQQQRQLSPQQLQIQQRLQQQQPSQERQILHLVVGPQLVSSVGSKTQGVQLPKEGPPTGSQEIFYGQPIVIDSNSRLGRHFLAEQKQKRQMKRDDSNYNKRRLAEKQKEKKINERYKSMQPNVQPIAHPNKITQRKVTTWMDRELELKKMETARDFAWREHQRETNQSEVAKKVKEIEDQIQKNQQMSFHALVEQITPEQLYSFRQENPTTVHQQTLPITSTQEGNPWSLKSDDQMPPQKSPVSPTTEIPTMRGADGSPLLAHDTKESNVTVKLPQEQTITSQQQPPYSPVDNHFAKQIAQAAEEARKMNPENFHEIQEIIYKTVTQTDILNSPELQYTLQQQDTAESNLNPNAIVIRTSSLNQIAPVLRDCQQSPSAVVNSLQSMSDRENHGMVDPAYPYQLDSKVVEDMDIAQFSEAIKNMYLPFTLRKMYYKELMMRKPLFVGASRKGVGFGGGPGPVDNNKKVLLNERTSQAQNWQRAQQEAKKSHYDQIKYRNAVQQQQRSHTADCQLQQEFMRVSQVQLQPKEPTRKEQLRNQQTTQWLGRICEQIRLKGEQGAQTQTELRLDATMMEHPDFILKAREEDSQDKAIDMQSFGAMTGADPHAVREIEQLMLYNSKTDLKDSSTFPMVPPSQNQNQYSSQKPGVMMSLGEDKAETASMVNCGLEQKKSKVIFSVKKDQSQQNTSVFRKRDDHASASNLRSSNKVGRTSPDGNSSIGEATGKKGSRVKSAASIRASSALSNISSKQAQHEILDPRSKRFSTIKKAPIILSETPTELGEKIPHDGSTRIEPMSKKPMTSQFAKQDQQKSVNAKKQQKEAMDVQEHREFQQDDYEIKYQTQHNSIEKEGFGTDRTPEEAGKDPADENIPVDESLKKVNVSQIKIKVNKDIGEVLERPKSVLSQDITKKLTSKDNTRMDLSERERGFKFRSYTCVDLDQTMVSASFQRNIKSAIPGNMIISNRVSSIIEDKLQQQNGKNGKRQSQMHGGSPENGVVKPGNIDLNVNSNSNIGRIHLDQIKNSNSPVQMIQIQQKNMGTNTTRSPNEDMQQQLIGGLLAEGSAGEWYACAMQNNQIVEIGTDTATIDGLVDRHVGSNQRTLSPKILNIELDNQASPIGPDFVPYQLPVSIRNSNVLNSNQRNKPSKGDIISNSRSPKTGNLGIQLGNKNSVNKFNKIGSGALSSSPRRQPRRKRKSNRNVYNFANQLQQNELADQNSRASFGLSEGSQRTLTPLSCKNGSVEFQGKTDANGQYLLHSQGYVLHRGNRQNQHQQRARTNRQQQANSTLQNKTGTSDVSHGKGQQQKSRPTSRLSSKSQQNKDQGSNQFGKRKFSHKKGRQGALSISNTMQRNHQLTVQQQASAEPAGKESKDFDQHHQQQCTCSHQGKYRLDQLRVMTQDSSAQSGSQPTTVQEAAKEVSNSINSGGKNRVVFIVRNNEESQVNQNIKVLTGKNNSDLAHLPSYDQIKVIEKQRSADLAEIENSNSSAQKQTVFHVGVQQSDLNAVTPIPIPLNQKGKTETEDNKKSTSILDTSAKHSMARLIQSSISHNEGTNQDSRNYISNNQRSDVKLMTPQSSSNLQHVLPAVNSQNDMLNKNTSSNVVSYPEIIQMKADKNVKDKQAAKSKEKSVPKVEVKMRLSKNPNVCPPRFNGIKRNARPQTTTGVQTPISHIWSKKVGANELSQTVGVSTLNKTHKTNAMTDPIDQSNQIISIQVQNESEKKRNKQPESRTSLESNVESRTIVHPDFSSLKPYTIFTTDELPENVLNMAENKSQTIGDPTEQNENQAEGMQMYDSLVTLALKQKGRPQSQYHNTGRMNRLQRFYQTQRGRNIMNMGSKASRNTATSKMNTAVTVRQSKERQPQQVSSLLQAQRETMVSLNMTKVSDRGTNQPQMTANLTLESCLDGKKGLKMVGRQANNSVCNSKDLILSQKPPHSRQKSAQIGFISGQTCKQDVGQSVQRFSIHLSPKHQTLAIRAQKASSDLNKNGGDSTRKLNRDSKQRQSSQNYQGQGQSRSFFRDSGTGLDVSPDRGVSPLHFLPTLPENLNLTTKHQDQKSLKPVSKKHSSSIAQKQHQKEVLNSVAQEANNCEKTMVPVAEKSGTITGSSTTPHNHMMRLQKHQRYNSQTTYKTANNDLQRVTSTATAQGFIHEKQQEPVAQSGVFEMMPANQKSNATKTNNTTGLRVANTNKQIGKQRPMTTTNHSNTRANNNSSVAAVSSQMQPASQANLNNCKNSIRQRIVRGLASKHFNTLTHDAQLNATATRNTAMTNTADPQLPVASFGQKRNKRMFTVKHDTIHESETLKELTMLGSQNEILATKTPKAMLQNNVNMFDQQTVGTLVNSSSGRTGNNVGGRQTHGLTATSSLTKPQLPMKQQSMLTK